MKRKLLLAAAVTASLLNTGLKASNTAQTPQAKSWRETYASDYGSRAGKGLFGYGLTSDQFEQLPDTAGRFAKGKRKVDEFFGSKPAKMARTTGASLIGGASLLGAGYDIGSSIKNKYSPVGYKFATLVMRYSDEEAMAFAQKASTKVIAPVLSIILPYLMQSAIRPGKSYMRQGGEWVGGKASNAWTSFRAPKAAAASSAAPATPASADASAQGGTQ